MRSMRRPKSLRRHAGANASGVKGAPSTVTVNVPPVSRSRPRAEVSPAAGSGAVGHEFLDGSYTLAAPVQAQRGRRFVTASVFLAFGDHAGGGVEGVEFCRVELMLDHERAVLDPPQPLPSAKPIGRAHV